MRRAGLIFPHCNMWLHPSNSQATAKVPALPNRNMPPIERRLVASAPLPWAGEELDECLTLGGSRSAPSEWPRFNLVWGTKETWDGRQERGAEQLIGKLCGAEIV